jgi:hypothetical protein
MNERELRHMFHQQLVALRNMIDALITTSAELDAVIERQADEARPRQNARATSRVFHGRSEEATNGNVEARS